jgi:hypothetical protein
MAAKLSPPGTDLPSAEDDAAWDELYQRYSDAESRRDERQRKLAEERAALAEFEAWTRRATEQLMLDLATVARERSLAFLERTHHPLEVEYPSGPAISLPDGGPEIRFLRLSLGDARVHVYSSHTPGGLIHIHLLPSRRDSLQHNQRLLSEPGAFVVRLPDDSYELRFLAGDPEGVPRSPMSLDGLLFKAFRLLVYWAEDPSVLPVRRSRETRAEKVRPLAVTRIAFVDPVLKNPQSPAEALHPETGSAEELRG